MLFRFWPLAIELAVFCAVALAQQAPVPAITPEQRQVLNRAEAGVESPQDVQAMVAAILKEDDRLKPILDSMNPQVWYEKKGAPSTYVIQWQTGQREVQDVDSAAQLFSRKADDLTGALDLYFRMEALETTARAIDEGAQRYADPSSAARLEQFVAKNFDMRQRFRDYIRDLATSVQQNYKIADEEAQRCRAAQSNQTPCPPPKRPKRS